MQRLAQDASRALEDREAALRELQRVKVTADR
jgi:hypothetical protein